MQSPCRLDARVPFQSAWFDLVDVYQLADMAITTDGRRSEPVPDRPVRGRGARETGQNSTTDWHGGRLTVQVMLGSPSARAGGRRIRGRREQQIVTMPSVDRLSESMPVTIVLAEDDPVLRTNHAQVLREAGYEVREAEDGGQALALVRARAPDLLLIDAWLPVLNGLEVLERLKSSPEAVGLSTVVLSNQNDADTRLEGSALRRRRLLDEGYFGCRPPQPSRASRPVNSALVRPKWIVPFLWRTRRGVFPDFPITFRANSSISSAK